MASLDMKTSMRKAVFIAVSLLVPGVALLVAALLVWGNRTEEIPSPALAWLLGWLGALLIYSAVQLLIAFNSGAQYAATIKISAHKLAMAEAAVADRIENATKAE